MSIKINLTKSYFNQTLDGVGYLNRIEWLTPENGDPYLVATINSVVGPESKTWNTRFDREDLEFISANVELLGHSCPQTTACYVFTLLKVHSKIARRNRAGLVQRGIRSRLRATYPYSLGA